MTGLRVDVPIASWRVEFDRQYRTTHRVPPPLTCYGFLLSLVGETRMDAYLGTRVTAGLVSAPAKSTILRKIRRDGKGEKPDVQEVLAGVDLLVWFDGAALEARVLNALLHPEAVERFGGLSLGESTFLVNSVKVVGADVPPADTFLLADDGTVHLPVHADYQTCATTRHACGNMTMCDRPPQVARLPVID